MPQSSISCKPGARIAWFSLSFDPAGCELDLPSANRSCVVAFNDIGQSRLPICCGYATQNQRAIALNPIEGPL